MRLTKFPVTKATEVVVVYQSNSVHEGIANGRADKLKAATAQVFAHCVRFVRVGRHASSAFSLLWNTSDELPYVTIEGAKLLRRSQERLCILNGRCNLQAIANDAGVLQQLLTLALVVTSHLGRIKAAKSCAIAFALVEDDLPT